MYCCFCEIITPGRVRSLSGRCTSVHGRGGEPENNKYINVKDLLYT